MGISACGNAQTEVSTDSTVQEEETTVEETVVNEESTEDVLVERENTTFRNAIWGDDMETVKKYETEIALEEGENSLIGQTTIVGLESDIVYYFDSQGKLYQGIYGIKTKEGVGEGVYISDYNNLKNKLTELYGEPVSDEIIPLTDQSQIDYTGEENSLKFGYTAYKTIWNTETTEILLGMQSQNYQVYTMLAYTDINYEEDLSESGL